MPKTTNEPNITSQTGRRKLAVRREPYFKTLQPNLKLGYRAGAGSWVAALYDPETRKRTFKALGSADDDTQKADGDTVLSYDQAADAAREWLITVTRAVIAGHDPKRSYKIKDAIEDYLTAYERRGGKASDRVKASADAHIIPELGEVECAKLTRKRLHQWLDKLVATPPRLRTKPGKDQNFRTLDRSPEGIRRRRSSANRVLTVLKAALNHARHEGHIAHADAWETVKPFREADAARVRYLNEAETKRLLNACQGEFRKLVSASLLTGCRYGELVALRAADFNHDAGTVHVRISKSGKGRHVVLTDEGRKFFAASVVGKAPDALIFFKDGGQPWGRADQFRPFKLALGIAKIGAMTFHELRHTYASRLVMAGAPLMVVAKQLGHADSRMVEKHYGHLAPSYVADTVRASLGEIGVSIEQRVTELRRA
ncbi:MAG TPA: site-specific integrase [Magnetospirillum sp.]|nr:site-specific integrase [Magnetospirillum sp.]